MSTSDLNAAKSLIQQKRYAEARALLKTIDHPTAAKWLARLDEIDPPEPTPAVVKPSVKQRPRSDALSVVITLALIFLAGVVIYQQIQLNNLSRIVGVLETDISTVRTMDPTSLSSRIALLELDVSDLVSVVNSHASDINTLSFNLQRVSAVANNADRYAHSHNSFSDAALKTEISPVDNALGRLLTLHGVSFSWNSEAYPDLLLESGRDYGVLAQELAEVFPELVTTDDETGLLRVDYEGLIPILIEALREQQQQIDELRTMLS